VTDLGSWAGTGLGTALLPVDLGEQHLQSTEIAADTSGTNTIRYGLGIMDFGIGWIGHTGQLIGWESIVLYNAITGTAFVGMVNETGSLTAPILVALSVFPELAEGFS
jgi:hypothetical protein